MVNLQMVSRPPAVQTLSYGTSLAWPSQSSLIHRPHPVKPETGALSADQISAAAANPALLAYLQQASTQNPYNSVGRPAQQQYAGFQGGPRRVQSSSADSLLLLVNVPMSC